MRDKRKGDSLCSMYGLYDLIFVVYIHVYVHKYIYVYIYTVEEWLGLFLDVDQIYCCSVTTEYIG